MLDIFFKIWYLYVGSESCGGIGVCSCSCGGDGESSIFGQCEQLGDLFARIHAPLPIKISQHSHQLHGDFLPFGPTWGLLV